jgi:hypothetical protein
VKVNELLIQVAIRRSIEAPSSSAGILAREIVAGNADLVDAAEE